MDNIEKIQEYVPIVYVNDSSPDLDEVNLNKAEQAIKRVTDAANKAIQALNQLEEEKLSLSAISNVLSDAVDKVPSLALVNTMQHAINEINSNLGVLQGSIDKILPEGVSKMSVGYNDATISGGWNTLTIPLARVLDSVGSVQVTIHSPSGAVRALVETLSWTNDSVTVSIYNFDTGATAVGVMVQVWGT